MRLRFSNAISSESRSLLVIWFDRVEKVVWTRLKEHGATAQRRSARSVKSWKRHRFD